MPYDTSMGALIRDAARVTTSAAQFERVVESVVKANGRVSDGHKYEVDSAPLIAARTAALAACELLEKAMDHMDTAVEYGHWTMDDVIEWLDYNPDEEPEEEERQLILCGCSLCTERLNEEDLHEELW